MSVWGGRPARAKSPLHAERDQIGVGRESFPVRWRHHPGIRVLAITSTFVAALFAPALAAEAQLVPLQDYIGQSRVEKDPVALGYVAERCSALYSVFGKNLEGETDPERQRVMSEAFNAGERFMGLAVKLMISGTTIGVEVVLRRTQKTWRTWATSTLTALRQPGFAPATCSATTWSRADEIGDA